MAAEWAGVIGTAIGAGIGGIVTVASLIVRGRQEAAREQRRLDHEKDTEQIRIQTEERRRARDREWDVTLHGIEPRRDAYVRLLRAVAEYDEQVELLVTAGAVGRTVELTNPARGDR